MLDLRSVWWRVEIEQDRLEQHRLTGFEELGRRDVTIFDRKYACRDLGLEIGRELSDPERRSRFVELPADFRHPLRDCDDGSERRDRSGPDQEFDVTNTKPAQHRADIVILRIEIENLLGLCPTFVCNDG